MAMRYLAILTVKVGEYAQYHPEGLQGDSDPLPQAIFVSAEVLCFGDSGICKQQVWKDAQVIYRAEFSPGTPILLKIRDLQAWFIFEKRI